MSDPKAIGRLINGRRAPTEFAEMVPAKLEDDTMRPDAISDPELRRRLQRAFVSEPEISRQKWNILMRFRIFYLCNGCSIKRFLPPQRSGQRGRSICATRTFLCYLVAKDKNSQNVT